MNRPLQQVNETVVLLHGLARSRRSMARLGAALERAGFRVANIGYPSRHYPVEVLAGRVRGQIVRETAGAARVHCVTHSMGGILVRHIQRHAPLPNLGRVVMLSPPNQGSEIPDRLGHLWLYRLLNGPAGQELGRGGGSLIPELGPVDFELGVITGDRSINWILSLFIPGPNDGKVSVESARVAGMKAFKVVHATHPLIMRNRSVIKDVACFLRTGRFTG